MGEQKKPDGEQRVACGHHLAWTHPIDQPSLRGTEDPGFQSHEGESAGEDSPAPAELGLQGQHVRAESMEEQPTIQQLHYEPSADDDPTVEQHIS